MNAVYSIRGKSLVIADDPAPTSAPPHHVELDQLQHAAHAVVGAPPVRSAGVDQGLHAHRSSRGYVAGVPHVRGYCAPHLHTVSARGVIRYRFCRFFDLLTHK